MCFAGTNQNARRVPGMLQREAAGIMDDSNAATARQVQSDACGASNEGEEKWRSVFADRA
jgi:hypothetical protein